jgi:hypothetical protein
VVGFNSPSPKGIFGFLFGHRFGVFERYYFGRLIKTDLTKWLFDILYLAVLLPASCDKQSHARFWRLAKFLKLGNPYHPKAAGLVPSSFQKDTFQQGKIVSFQNAKPLEKQCRTITDCFSDWIKLMESL